MPTITLRVSEQEHRYLAAMAKFKKVSLSDLIREYSRTGVVRDAQRADVNREIDEEIARTEEHLRSIGAILEEAAAAPLPSPAYENDDSTESSIGDSNEASTDDDAPMPRRRR